MLDWPTDADYSEALQHPDRAFRDPFLQRCTIELNKLKQPRPRSGGFANVYKLSTGSTVKAVKLFKHPQKERAERYSAIDEHLRGCRLQCLVNFTYDPYGIRIRNAWYPVQTMDWVEGQKLSHWVREVIHQRNHHRLIQMADRWIDLMEDLDRSQIAHGDLQHDNIIVVNDNLVLVDYDGLCVPQLQGRDALECGKPAYQHPKRKGQKLSLDMDHFAAWIILIALRGLAADMSLWERFVEIPKNENLLFSEADIQEPTKSALWNELLASRDPDVRSWTERLLASLPDKPYSTIPRFQIDRLEPLRNASQAKDWEKIYAIGSEFLAKGRLPATYHAIVSEAKRRIACRRNVEEALQQGDIRKVAKEYVAELLDDWDSCHSLVQQARDAVEKVGLIDALTAAMRNPGDGRRLVSLWDESAYRLAGLREVDSIQHTVELWRARIQACEKLLALVQGNSDPRQIVSAWDALEQLGGHPDAAIYCKLAEQARQRAALLDNLHRLSVVANESNDRQFCQLWEESALQCVQDAVALKTHFKAAKQRLQVLEALENAIRTAQPCLTDESRISALAAQIPNGYSYELLPRVARARENLRLLQRLRTALDAIPASDRAIADAWRDVEAANLLIDNTTDRARCDLALRRCQCLDRIKSIDSTMPEDQQDESWLATWDATLLNSCSDADPYRPRYEKAKLRLDTWRALERSLAENDLYQIKTLAKAKILEGYPPFLRRRREILQTIEYADRLARVELMISSGSLSNDPMAEDFQFLAQHWDSFPMYHKEIAAQLQVWVHSKLQLLPGQPSWVIDHRNKTVRIRWTWPHFGRISYCLLAIDSNTFLHAPDEAADGVHKIDHNNYRMAIAAGGHSIPLLSDHPRCLYITIWPVVCLGNTTFFGRPLHIGPIRPRKLLLKDLNYKKKRR